MIQGIYIYDYVYIYDYDIILNIFAQNPSRSPGRPAAKKKARLDGTLHQAQACAEGVPLRQVASEAFSNSAVGEGRGGPELW